MKNREKERKGLSRRSFIGEGLGFAAAAFCPVLFCESFAPAQLSAAPGDIAFTREASWYETLPDGRVRCLLCPNACVRSDGARSRCHARQPRNGKLYSLVYNLPCVITLDHIEKCPLYHVSMNGRVFSIATAGCNLACEYCQNWEFSQCGPETTKNFRLTPARVVSKALEKGCPAIAFFYTEPTVYYEYMWDIAGLARDKGLKTIMVTAGYINPEPLKALLGRIDYFTVGLKGFTESFYMETIHGRLAPVKRCLKILHDAGKWFEIVNLIIPGRNDSISNIGSMAAWIKSELSAEVPLHFTRFRPQFRLRQLPLTPRRILEAAREKAVAEGLKFVYIGNLPGHDGNHTYCPACGAALVTRLGFEVVENKLSGSTCPYCGYKLAGHWDR